MHDLKYINYLLKRHLNGDITAEEADKLNAWVQLRPENRHLLAQISTPELLTEDLKLFDDLWNEEESQSREQRIYEQVAQKTKLTTHTKKQAFSRWLPYAAAVVMAIASFLYLNNKPEQPAYVAAKTSEDILPGGYKASLKLSGNRVIDLSSKQSGIVIGDQITYLDGSTVSNDAKSETLILQTPIGGNYQVVLPDGSRVWLNANTTLTYPSHFDKNERLVQLEGEAYFEVKPLKHEKINVPFKVLSNGQYINVLGTEFNLAAYADEPSTKTTLINGSVEIKTVTKISTKITPGQQATLVNNNFNVANVDITKVTAWKTGQFSFDNKSFEEIMREMARWYNFSVLYEGKIPKDRFIGNAFKTDKLSTVLRFLESSYINYRLKPAKDGKRILVISNAENRKEDNQE